MTEQRPAPLVPADVDLRDFKFMPLEVGRLMRSKAWLMAKRQPELGFYMINLWGGAWHEVPAASLEDDDDVLADVAKCDPSRWAKVREKALHGWVKCADGRLYHPVVAEKVMEAWSAKQGQRQRTEAARQARDRRRQEQPHAMSSGATEAATTTVAIPVTTSVATSVTENVTGSKGQGQGQGDSSSPPSSPEPQNPPDAISDSLPGANGHDGNGPARPIEPARPPSDRRTHNGPKPVTEDDLAIPEFLRRHPEKRLKRQDVADRDMAAWLTTKGGLDGQRAWALLMAARDPNDAGHTEAARELERISRANRLGWFAGEEAAA